MTPQQNTLDGYMKDSMGRLVPIDLVSDIDKQRHETVTELAEKAFAAQKVLITFKQACIDDVQAFIDLSAEKYDKNLGGVKGNVQLLSFDGQYKIVRNISEHLAFDERLQVAKELIDKCIIRWSKGSQPEIQALVQDAFQTDRQGKINTSRVLGLRRLEIDDTEWVQAMQAISDSIQVVGSKTYVRLYKRVGDSEQFQPIALDIAAI